MDAAILALSALTVLVVLCGAIVSMRIGKATKKETDSSVSESISRHPVGRNPIFWVYGIAALLILGYIVYLAITYTASKGVA
ncbi:hypothetical protein [Aureibacillus halotolerans]|uniref:Uncharacterized protein n=1 Tax=Aureibacillus halotolerans TaxID=1508390 RepID=A0A4R6U6U9_9BACI|nr:hypothetical protein [Aureibacillus halotolerans]TDQ42240.1 hypothetical protein EV213_102271 [Aureibacillus halotolerans]